MVPIASILIAASGLIVSVLANPISNQVAPFLPDEITSNSTSIELSKRADEFEKVIMLMGCTYQNSASPVSSFAFSHVGLYKTIAKSQDGSLPSSQNGWYSVRGSVSFEEPFKADIDVASKDVRIFESYIGAGSLAKKPETVVGFAYVVYNQQSAAINYDCKRDGGRVVFDVPAGKDRVVW
ncbi:hypothetical protein HDU97_005906 [Phlyctochytrium planicorne]|nr:hypothetical protein HDU97_005906 [Phlyctochytrium planicorne]